MRTLALKLCAGLLLCSGMAQGQFIGYTAQQTLQQTIFLARTTTGTFPVTNLGQSAHWLTYCVTATVNTLQIRLEESPDGGTTWVPMGTPGTGLVGCNILQISGYFPLVRVNVVVLTVSGGGSISAWYSAQSGPVPTSAGAVGSSGPALPVACDQAVATNSIASGGFTAITLGSPRGLVICGFSISFAGATSSVTDGFELGYGPSCGSATYLWRMTTTASTPQFVPVGGGFGLIFQAQTSGGNICVNNNSGAALQLNITYATS